jgi:cytochrome c biogenesis protein CcdA
MEGLSIYNALISFAGGILSFLSPCVLPLVPGYISLISGVSIDRLKGDEGSTAEARRAVILNSLAFNAGISMIFLLLGSAAGLVGSELSVWRPRAADGKAVSFYRSFIRSDWHYRFYSSGYLSINS